VKKPTDLSVDGLASTSVLPPAARAINNIVEFEAALVAAAREMNFKFLPRSTVVDAFADAGSIHPFDRPFAGCFGEDIKVSMNSALFAVDTKVPTPSVSERFGEVATTRTRSDDPELLPVRAARMLSPFEGRLEKGHGFLQLISTSDSERISLAGESGPARQDQKSGQLPRAEAGRARTW
jgi:hypothetical protein